MENILKSKFWPVAGQFLSASWILLGLPLVAWGPRDLNGFLSNPVRTGFAAIVIAQALVSSWMAYKTPPHAEHEHRFDLARWHSYMFETIFVLAAFGDRRNILTWDENPPLRWAGLGIYLIGVSLSVWANITWVNHLRREGERAFDNAVLLFEGPFKLIRYPSLLYLAFYCLGFAIMFRSWIGLALMIPLMGGIINRINNLEKIFAEQYKKIWALRRLNSKRFIPYLY